MKCDQEPSTLDVVIILIKLCQSTVLIVIGSKCILERGERANLIIQGKLRAFREAVSMKYKTEVGPDHVLMSWMVRHCAWVVNNECFIVLSGARITLEKLCHLEKCAWSETILRMEPS